MSKNQSLFALSVIALFTLFLLIGCVGHDESVARQSTVCNVVEDSAITTAIKAKYLTDKKVGVLDIFVETNNGVVILTGTAPTKPIVDRAVRLAKSVDGVKHVIARIKVTYSKEN
jgi:osmotically-inducible protein OsmY